MMKLCCEVLLINNFQWESCSCVCLEHGCENNFEIDEFTHFTTISVHPLIDATAAYLCNGCIDLHV